MEKLCQCQESVDKNFLQYYQQGLEIIVVGASGDLAKKKTYPALFDLFMHGFIPPHAKIYGFARSSKENSSFRESLRPFLVGISSDTACTDDFLEMCFYQEGQYGSVESMQILIKKLDNLYTSPQFESINRVFYFAIPPNVFLETAATIKAVGLSSSGWTRLIIEKPFGHDLQSAQQLAQGLTSHFTEDYIYRIDHYLGKEMVQNLMVLRFSNIMWESLWNRNIVQSVLITFKEPFGTQGRGGYFDNYGIIRDIMQNHLMQVLSLVAMEPPVHASGQNSADFVRDEKVKLLRCIAPIKLEDTVIGQYTAAEDGSEQGYLEDPTVPDDSITPTFCQSIIWVQNPRWHGVPFIMKAGKALDERKAEVRIQFKEAPAAAFMFDGASCGQNELVIKLQPVQAIYLKTNVKSPGLRTQPELSELDLSYDSRYASAYNPDAYTRLILDVLRGGQATFVRSDELCASWNIFDPLLKELEEKQVKPIPYRYGSRGPAEADQMRGVAGFNYTEGYIWRSSLATDEESSKTTKLK